MRRLLTVLSVAVLASGAFAAPAAAQQSLSLYGGRFSPNGETSRIQENGFSNDVLVNNLDFLLFDIDDFKGGTFGADYLIAIGDYVEAGLGVGYYQKTVPTIWDGLVDDTDGSPIETDLKLRIVPMSATVRFLPIGRTTPVQPYIGAGVGVFAWRYIETGEFLDFDDFIFRATYEGSGTTTGPLILGGVRFPIGNFDVGGEVRWQKAEGELPADQFFSADKIDLGGWTWNATFNIRF